MNQGACALTSIPQAPAPIPLCTCAAVFAPPQCRVTIFELTGNSGSRDALTWSLFAITLVVTVIPAWVGVEHIRAQRAGGKITSYQKQQLVGAFLLVACGLSYTLFWAINPLGLHSGYPSRGSMVLGNIWLFFCLIFLALVGAISVGGYIGVALFVKDMKTGQPSTRPTWIAAIISGVLVGVASLASIISTAAAPSYSQLSFVNIPFIFLFIVVFAQFALSVACSLFIFCSARAAQQGSSNKQQQLKRFAIRSAVVTFSQILTTICLFLIIFRSSQTYAYFVAMVLVVPSISVWVFLVSSSWLFRLRPKAAHDDRSRLSTRKEEAAPLLTSEEKSDDSDEEHTGI